MFRCLGLLVVMAAAGLGQQGLIPADSAKPSIQSDSTRRVPGKSPGTAVLLSFLVPGGGQVYTQHCWKAALIAPAELTLGYFIIKENSAAGHALRVQNDTTYVIHRDRRTTLLWFEGAVLAFSMADAYVSAQMYGFDRELRFAGLGARGLRLAIAPDRIEVRAGI
jgi:hypothetical protein